MNLLGWSAGLRGLVSVLLVLHFFLIGLTYATNARRSSVQDSVHVWLQPYSIPGNWYFEMLSFDGLSGKENLNSLRISVARASSDEWETIMAMWPKDQRGFWGLRFKSNRLMSLVQELVANDDQEGLLRILRSVVKHLDAKTQPANESLTRIRLDQNAGEPEASSSDLPESSQRQVILEASIARLEDGEFGLIPKIDAHREVSSRGSRP
jgi:hypothetical protein